MGSCVHMLAMGWILTVVLSADTGNVIIIIIPSLVVTFKSCSDNSERMFWTIFPDYAIYSYQISPLNPFESTSEIHRKEGNDDDDNTR